MCVKQLYAHSIIIRPNKIDKQMTLKSLIKTSDNKERQSEPAFFMHTYHTDKTDGK